MTPQLNVTHPVRLRQERWGKKKRKRLLLLWMKLDRVKTTNVPHPNEHEREEYHILHSVVSWHQDRFMWKERIAITVRQLSFHISKHPPIPFLPYSHPPSLISFSSSVSALIYFSLSFLALSWSSFCFFIDYSLNHGSLMSFSLTFFICQCVLAPTFHSQPISTGFSFKALI